MERAKYEAILNTKNNQEMLNSLYEKEKIQFRSHFCSLEGHQVTKEYRTKMVDWMVEVCSSFRCSDRTYFLAVSIFDKYLSLIKGKKIIKNPEVHAIGITAMYLASKYEDVLPINSFIAFEKISHKSIPQQDILNQEKDFLRCFDFDLELVTSYDFHMFIFEITKSLMGDLSEEEYRLLAKVEELSLLLLRMAL